MAAMKAQMDAMQAEITELKAAAAPKPTPTKAKTGSPARTPTDKKCGACGKQGHIRSAKACENYEMTGSKKIRKPTKAKCSVCNIVGHIRSSRECPQYKPRAPKAAAAPVAAGGAGSDAPPPASLDDDEEDDEENEQDCQCGNRNGDDREPCTICGDLTCDDCGAGDCYACDQYVCNECSHMQPDPICMTCFNEGKGCSKCEGSECKPMMDDGETDLCTACHAKPESEEKAE